MHKEEAEGRIRTAVEHAAPDVFEQVLARRGEQTETVVPIAPPKRRPVRAVVAAAAVVLLLVCGGGVGWNAWLAGAVDSVVILDVNPSISLTVNAKEKVIAAQALNADAEVVLGSMDLTGTSLDVAVNALIGSMVKNGYLSYDNFENSILVSIENSDVERAAQLQQKVRDMIDSLLTGGSLILTQSVDGSSDLQDAAQKYGISIGKAALIQEVTSQDAALTFDMLASLSVNEITLISNSRGLSTSNVTQSGEPNTAGYISSAAALEAACSHAAVSADQITSQKVEFDWEDGRMIYEVEFRCGELEYEYDIDASTGAVLHHKWEDHSTGHHGTGTVTQPSTEPANQTASPSPSPSASPSPAPAGSGDIGQEAAKAAALSLAGLTESQTTNMVVKRDWDDGRLEYKVEFWSGNVEYEYEIDGTTGAVLKSERKDHGGTSTPAAGTSYIGEEAAKTYAFTHAGCAAGDASSVTCKLDRGDHCYEVEFWVGNSEYEYEIDCYSGAVLKSERKDHSGTSAPASGASYIGEDAAKAYALTHAGCAAGDVSAITCELDRGDHCYEVEFWVGDSHYKYEIDCYSGAVLKHECKTGTSNHHDEHHH